MSTRDELRIKVNEAAGGTDTKPTGRSFVLLNLNAAIAKLFVTVQILTRGANRYELAWPEGERKRMEEDVKKAMDLVVGVMVGVAEGVGVHP